MKTDEKLRSILKDSIDTNKWHSILKNYFNIKNLRREGPEKMDRTDGVNQGYYHGSIKDEKKYVIGLFSYDVQRGDVSRKKIGLRNLVKQFINVRYGDFDAAWVVFYGKKEWRMSFICDIKDVKTDPKRYTYVFGNETALYRTPMDRLLQLKDAKYSFNAFQSAFSVEALSDAFFDGYREKYADFVQSIMGKRYVKEGNKYVEKIVGKPNNTLFNLFEKDGKRVRDYVKKMMGRLTFLHFLQHKGWMNGDLNYMQGLFNRKSTQYRGRYLSDVLEPLFFGVLNTKESDREKVFQDNRWNLDLLEEWKNIPYLNGGLFEADKEDEVECDFKDTQFRELFDFFSQYNFTIDENDPNDAEVGVDPEMLGKIFENLLEDNKDKGAFYTPKEIVQYMCQESLIAYLNNSTSIAQEKIKKFVQIPEDGINDIPENKRDKLNEALKNVKICDPAIGSGAFPMGLLNLLLRCREAIEQGRVSVSELKKEIIKNNIYGVDIEKGAVDIARLRFWLSIVVDDDKPTPLPNLDYKIMQGNSLLESYKGIDLSKLTQSKDAKKYGKVASLFDAELEKYQKDILLLLSNYYLCNDHQQKQKIQQKIINTVYQLLDTQDDDSLKIDELKRYDICGNDQFFLWHTWFNDVFEKGGFDIVIGNPPYVSVKAISEEMKDTYRNIFQTAKGRFNLFTLFIELFYNIGKKNGTFCLIIPEGIYSNIEYRYSRQLLAEKCIICKLCLFTHRVFTASVDTTIVVANHSSLIKNQDCILDVDLQASNRKINQLEIKTYPYYIFPVNLTTQNHQLINKLVLSDQYTKIDQYLEIQQGIIYSGLSKEEVFADSILNPTYKPILDGRDIEKWRINWDIKEYDKYISYTQRLHRPREERLFLSDKIIFPRRATQIVATLDEQQYYVLNTAYVCPLKNNMYPIEYILSILNSSIIKFIYNQLFFGWQITIPAIEIMPVPKISKNDISDIVNIVRLILSKKKKNKNYDCKDEEIKLNYLLYKAYNLSQQEIDIIENDLRNN